MADRRESLLAAAKAALEVASVDWHSEVTTKPEGLRVYRHRTRQADVSLLPDLSVLYMGETLSTYAEGATGESRREVEVGVLARALADADESGDQGLIPVMQWAEIALLYSNFGALGGIASKGELLRIEPLASEEHADTFAEALMRFSFTVHTKWGDPRQAP